jgi:hypothetical protein
MKRYALLVTAVFLFSSCGTWPAEEKEMFHQSCLEDAKERGMTEAQAKKMCDCRLEKMMTKYPKVEDALENIQEIMNDPAIQACEQEAMK